MHEVRYSCLIFLQLLLQLPLPFLHPRFPSLNCFWRIFYSFSFGCRLLHLLGHSFSHRCLNGTRLCFFDRSLGGGGFLVGCLCCGFCTFWSRHVSIGCAGQRKLILGDFFCLFGVVEAEFEVNLKSRSHQWVDRDAQVSSFLFV